MKVRCIDDKTPLPDDPPLVEGKVYEVKGSNSSDYLLVGQPMTWRKDRFVVVDDSPIPEPECPCGIRRNACDYHKDP